MTLLSPALAVGLPGSHPPPGDIPALDWAVFLLLALGLWWMVRFANRPPRAGRGEDA